MHHLFMQSLIHCVLDTVQGSAVKEDEKHEVLTTKEFQPGLH